MTMHMHHPNHSMARMMKLMNEVHRADQQGDEEVVERVWMPRVDILEDQHEFRVHADLPGVTRDSIEITLEDGVLTLSGERPARETDKAESWHLVERAHGRFSRRFNVRETIDGDKIHAHFDNGVLTIRLPKLEQAKPRKIEIETASA